MPFRRRGPEIAEFFVAGVALWLAGWIALSPDVIFDELQFAMVRVFGLSGPLIWNTASLIGGLVYAAGLILEYKEIPGRPRWALWLRIAGGLMLFGLWAYTAHVIGLRQWQSSLVPIYTGLAGYTLFALIRTIVHNYAPQIIRKVNGQ